ncbi:MAG: zinc-ribbon domain containing protein [Chloroflexi bacterium]|nr:zinc-ribbon domain containing protein [Chloroflexota bacterium]
MSYTDKSLVCRDCGSTFTFTEGEQEFYAQKGFTNEPSRCPDCRAARKQGRSQVAYDSDRGYGYGREPRQMYEVPCSQCGQTARVPFQPRTDKPVYCSNCFEQQRGYR